MAKKRDYREIALWLTIAEAQGIEISDQYKSRWVAPNPNKKDYPGTWVGIVFDREQTKPYFHGGRHFGLTTALEVRTLLRHPVRQRRTVLLPQFAAALKSVAEDKAAPRWQRNQAQAAYKVFEPHLTKKS